MQDADALTSIYEYLESTVHVPLSFDDLLRSKIVYSVSAFDKFIHDIVRIGMVQIFAGKRAATPKYLSETITISNAQKIAMASTPPAEVIFEQTIQLKLKSASFQSPEKVADGLSYIWEENYKWQRIARGIGISEKTIITTLKLIVERRNRIVHEADTDPLTGVKRPITKHECDDIHNFLLKLGNEIYNHIA